MRLLIRVINNSQIFLPITMMIKLNYISQMTNPVSKLAIATKKMTSTDYSWIRKRIFSVDNLVIGVQHAMLYTDH